MTAHIVWDWNGTLFDDIDISVAAASAACRTVGGGDITHEAYRRAFTRPVRSFYASLLERPFTDLQWKAIAECYHRTYRDLLDRARLREGVAEILDSLAGAGVTHSLLSMGEHDEVVALLEREGLLSRFLVAEGMARQQRTESKQAVLARHLDAVRERHPDELSVDRVLLIGDTLDDNEAAVAVGASCVLLADGSYDPERAAAVAVPVAASLSAAAELGLRAISARPGPG
ncbi:HAD family hydrolase [Streptomyces chrestomyceticus]|uniref:HAD family hydrolase n=1 Tax=Streptomyces chrestomyceticus TaxID=68185 RepID=UPI003792DB10